MLDLVLRGGTVVDGTGAPAGPADVGVRDGRIVAVGPIDEGAARTIDVTGMVVCPGFIDVHTHYDAQLLWDTTASPSVLHGVTTVLGGNCGFSIAPLGPDDADYIQRMMAVVEGIPLDALEGGGSVGVAIVRRVPRPDRRRPGRQRRASWSGTRPCGGSVMGDAATPAAATPEQLDGHGSTGGGVGRRRGARASRPRSARATSTATVEPVPSRTAAFEEFVALAGALRDHRARPSSSSPPSGRSRPSAWSSWPTCRWPPTGRSTGTCSAAWRPRRSTSSSSRRPTSPRREGAHVVALTLPDLMRMRATSVLRRPARLGRRPRLGRRAGGGGAAADPGTRARLRAGAEQAAERAMGVLADFALMEVADPASAWVGRSLGEIAAARGTDVIDVLIDVVLVDGLALYLVLPSLTPSLGRSDEGWRVRSSVWRDRRVMLGGSDAGAHLDLMCHANYPTVVLGEAVRDRGLLSIEEAVEMMTDRPARHYGLRQRGRVAPGWHADLWSSTPPRWRASRPVVRRDLPGGGERLYAASVGVDHVFVGGREVVTGGTLTDERPGRVLRSGNDTETVSLADVRR